MIGAGALGAVGLTGGSVVAQEDDEEADPRLPAIRVVHASPDAPAVDLLAAEVSDGTEQDDAEPEPLIEDIEYSDVTQYAVVLPGTYRIQIAVNEDDIDELEDLRDGGGDETEDDGDEEGDEDAEADGDEGDDEETDEDRILFETELELPTRSSFTAVAFGEAQMGLPDEKGGDSGAGDVDGNDQFGDREGLQITVLEDELSEPAEGMTRFRIFHAVPDLDEVSLTAVPGDEDDYDEGELERGDVEDATTLAAGLAFGESVTNMVGAGDYVVIIRDASGEENGGTTGNGIDGGNETDGTNTTDDGTGGTGDAGAGDVITTYEIGPNPENVYSEYYLGYVDPLNAPLESVDDLEDVPEFQVLSILDGTDGMRDEDA